MLIDEINSMNWLLVFPLGLASLLFLVLSIRRLSRFNFHNYKDRQEERFKDFFIAFFDLVALMIAVGIAISPPELWLVIVPIIGGGCIAIIPVAALSSYWKSFISRKMYESLTDRFGGTQQGYESFGDFYGQVKATLEWYEYIPIAFVIGWLGFFVVCALLVIATVTVGKSQELYKLSINISFLTGIVIGAISILLMLVISKRPNTGST